MVSSVFVVVKFQKVRAHPRPYFLVYTSIQQCPPGGASIGCKFGIICVEVGHQVVIAYDLGNWCCIDGEQRRGDHGTLRVPYMQEDEMWTD